MNIHKHARMTMHGRALLVERVRSHGWRVAVAAGAAGISVRTAYKWLARYRHGGLAGLADRRPVPGHCPHRLSGQLVAEIETLRRQRLAGPAIAHRLRLARSTVGAVLRRLGLGRLTALEPRPPVIRYERERPGELIHLDIKKLGKIDGVGHRIHGDRTRRARHIGWEYLHVAIDDRSRLAFSALLGDEKKESACAFLARARSFFAAHGIGIERVMTDNGSAYRSQLFRDALAAAGIVHKRTRPYTPRTNGKAERFIQTSLREWAYASPYASSADRATALPAWIESYNTLRPHSALNGSPPVSRLNNVLGFDT